MRLHLVISRHGLPVTRILWTTTSSTSTLGEYGTHRPAPAAAIASSRTPNVAFSNGGYTIAQLLEDVNEVVPLETEPSVFDAEFSGQWGLEDYVVEVAGSECLHFMEVEGLLRDGDEVVIRALQLADLRARRLCGRHQITAEGKHLIDGVAFGSPFLKRTTTSRPAITIPPRKKRRTVLSGWEQPSDFVPAPVHVDEEEDGEWLPPPETGFGKELSIMAGEHDESLGTVIRHPVDYTAESESEAEVSEMSDIEENELESELKALKEDFEEPSQFVDIRNQTRGASGHAVRAASIVKRPTSKGSIAAASSLSSKRSRGDDSSPRTSKAVRFNKGAGKEDEAMPDLPQAVQAPPVEDSVAESSESDSSESSASSSDSDSEEESDSDSDEASSSEVEPASEASDSDSSSSSEDSDSSESESEEEAPPPPKTVQRPVVSGIPGEGTMRTKKSNNRLKLRRRLSKLKELGALPQEADFEALRAWEQSHGGWHFPEQPVKPEPVVEPQQHVEPEMESAEALRKKQKRDKKQQEQEEFEARRQKLLQDLASGNGVYVDATSEKENVPPRASASIAQPLVSQDVSDEAEREQDASHRRNLDIASSRRMLFGERGMRTPKTKEDEEETRQKLAAAASAIGRPRKRSAQAAKEEADQMQEDEDESDINWQNKLVIRAVECVYPDVEMTAPPYPFVQRWDQEANDLIRQLKGPSKKRKRKQRVQVYDAYEEEYDEDANYYGGDDQYQDGADQENYEDYHAEEAPYYEGHYAGGGEANQLNYDDGPEPEPAPNASSDDLPALPSDVGTLSDLKESDVKVGAIIAFRQLDMSKATNWQPEMSGYRVAEVRSLQGKGVMNVLLAKRDRKPTSAFSEDDEPRQFSKFEVPDLANEEGEDDGYRELVFAELSEPKLLRPADRSDSVYGDQNNTREVQESVPIVQPGSPEEMYLDDTTFVTMGNDVTHLESPRESPGMPDESIEQTPGRPAVPQIQVQASDHRRVTPPIPSPTFTGFHSALSRQQTTPGLDNGRELEGRTLIGGETPSALVNRDEDPSMLTYMSANQSFADDPEDEDENEESFQSQEHERQVVPESLAPPGESGDSGAPSGSLLSTIDRAGSQGAQESTPVEKEVKEEVRKEVKEEKRSAAPTSSAESWRQLLDRLRNKSEPEPEMMSLSDSPGPFEDSEQLQDSLLQSNVELDFSFIDTARASSSRSPHPTMSAQQDAQSQKPNPFPPSSPSESPSLFTRSKHSQHALKSSAASQIPASQVSEVIDLTSSPRGSPEPSGSNLKLSQRSKSALFGDSQLDDGSRSSRQLTRASTGNIQHMVGVSVSPSSIKKKRTSRKF